MRTELKPRDDTGLGRRMDNPTESQFGNAAPVFLNPRLDPEHAAREIRLHDLAFVLQDLAHFFRSTYLVNDRLRQDILSMDADEARNNLLRLVTQEGATPRQRRRFHRRGTRRVKAVADDYRRLLWLDGCFPWNPDHSVRRRLYDADYRNAEEYLHWFSDVRGHYADVCHDVTLLANADLTRYPLKYERALFCQLGLVVCSQILDLLEELKIV